MIKSLGDKITDIVCDAINKNNINCDSFNFVEVDNDQLIFKKNEVIVGIFKITVEKV